MSYPEWMDLIAKGIVPLLAFGATVAALIISNWNFSRSMKQQQSQLEHQRQKDKRAEVEDERKRRRETYAEFFAAIQAHLNANIAVQVAKQRVQAVEVAAKQGTVPADELAESYKKFVYEYCQAGDRHTDELSRMSRAYQLFLCVFPQHVISPKFDPFWAELEKLDRRAGEGAIWTDAEMKPMSQAFHLWSRDQIEIIRKTGHD